MRIMEIAFGLESAWVGRNTSDALVPWQICAMSLILGVVLADSLGRWSFGGSCALILSAGSAFVGWQVLCVCRHRLATNWRFRLYWGVLWLLMWLVLGVFWGRPSPVTLPPLGVACVLEGHISSWADLSSKQADFKIDKWVCAGQSGEAAVRVRLKIGDDEALVIGSRIEVLGRFLAPTPKRAPGTFEYKRWMEHAGYDVVLRRSGTFVGGTFHSSPFKLLTMPTGFGASFYGGLSQFRQTAHEELAAGSPHGLMPALALGVGSGIDATARAQFGRLGIAHVLAVSGLHFGLVAMGVTAFLSHLVGFSPFLMRRFGRQRLSLALSFPFLGLYILCVGAPISAQRALIMMLSCSLGRLYARSPNKMRALALAAMVLVIAEPRAIFNLGFQLSFAAVLGLIAILESYDDALRLWLKQKIDSKRLEGFVYAVLSILLISFGTSLTTAPLLSWHFGQLPISGVLANLFAIPYVSFVLLPVSMAAVLCASIPFVGPKLLGLGGFLEDVFVGFSRFFSEHFPLTHLELVPHPVYFVFLLIAALCLLYPIRSKPMRRRLRFLTAFVLFLGLCLNQWNSRLLTFSDGLRMTFIDVEQADSTLIEFPNGQTMLVDAGLNLGTSGEMGARQIVPYLRFLGHKRIDYLVLSHSDYDHYAGMASVIEALEIGELWLGSDDAPDLAYQDLMALVAARKIPIKRGAALPEGLRIGEVELRVLWPKPSQMQRRNWGRNDQSIVLRIDDGPFSAILMGDAGKDVEAAIAEEGQGGRVSLLKVGHHGSRHSTSEAWLDLLRPQMAVISAGAQNRYHFPHQELMLRLLRASSVILRTDEDSSICLSHRDGRLRVQKMR